MLEAPHYSASGSRHAHRVALPDDLFDGTVNEAVLHQTIKAQLANQRQGTAKTKTRSFVSGGNQKPWKQKGTGRARQGSTRAPHWRGGGTVFGPIPRSYRQDVPRKVRQLARRSAFNARAREGRIHVIEDLSIDAPKTSALAGLLARLALAGQRTLVLTAGHKPAVYLSGRNIPEVDVLPFADASAYDIIRADALLIEQAAFGQDLAEASADRSAEAAPAAKPAARKSPARSGKARPPARAARGTSSRSKATKKAPARSARPKRAAPKKKKRSE
jgi:large subunit ribosomal protein L4